jgi:hypothetical protein
MTRRGALPRIKFSMQRLAPVLPLPSSQSQVTCPPEQLTASCSLALDVRIIVLPAPAPHSIDCNLSQPPSRTFHLRPAFLHRIPRTGQSRCKSHHLLTACHFSFTLCLLCLLLPPLNSPPKAPTFPPPLHLGTTSWYFVLCQGLQVPRCH